MSFFPWSDDYSVHFRVIDNDHKDLIEIVNVLYDAIANAEGRAQIGRTLSRLATYVDAHFAREEQLMEEYNYPGVAAHKRLHRRLARTVHAIRKVFAENPKSIDPNKLLNFLKEWLVQHILNQDTKYTPYFRGEQEANTSLDTGISEDDDLEIDFVSEEDHDLKTQANGEVEKNTITLSVPADKASVLVRCAKVLSDGGPLSTTIEDIVMPVGRLSLEEAEYYARDLLR